MTDEQIEYLKEQLSHGLMVWWDVGLGVYWRVVSVGANYDEPGPVAYFKDGKYCALWACPDPSDYIITSQDLAKWPKE